MDPSKAVFTILPKKIRQKAEIFRSFLKTIRSPTIFSKKHTFLQNLPLDMWNSVLTISSEVFWQKEEKRAQKREMISENTSVSKQIVQ